MKKLIGLKTIAIVASLGVSGLSLAGTQTWNLTNSSNLSGTGYGNTMTLSQGTVSLTASAWADTDVCSGETYSANTDNCIEQAELVVWSGGLGAINVDERNNGMTGSPQHALDNISNGGSSNDRDYEAVLLSFSEDVNISTLTTGWRNDNWTDITVLAYTGSTPFSGSLSGSWADLDVANGGGWTLVNNYDNIGSSVSLGTSLNAQFWVVGALNEVFGNPIGQGYNDAFKFAGLTSANFDTGNNEVSAGSAFAFSIIGLAFLLFRRKSK